MTNPVPDPHKDTRLCDMTRLATEISSINPELVIGYFIEQNHPEIIAELEAEIELYSEKFVMEIFRNNISDIDYQIKFFDLLSEEFEPLELVRLEYLLKNPKEDPALSNLVSKLLLGNQKLRECISEIFDEAISETKEELSAS